MKFLRRYLDEKEPALKNFGKMVGSLEGRRESIEKALVDQATLEIDPMSAEPRAIVDELTRDGGKRHDDVMLALGSAWGGQGR